MPPARPLVRARLTLRPQHHSFNFQRPAGSRGDLAHFFETGARVTGRSGARVTGRFVRAARGFSPPPRPAPRPLLSTAATAPCLHLHRYLLTRSAASRPSRLHLYTEHARRLLHQPQHRPGLGTIARRRATSRSQYASQCRAGLAPVAERWTGSFTHLRRAADDCSQQLRFGPS